MTDIDTVSFDFLYLLSCGINCIKPSPARMEQMDLERVYALSRKLSVDALSYFAVSAALEKGALSDKWKESASKALRKSILFDSEREALFDFCEEKGILHMPLKGILIQELYPALDTRQMADNDILYDIRYKRAIRKWFVAHGYECKPGGAYQKQPVLNFEMHAVLSVHSTFDAYYIDFNQKLIPTAQKKYEFHLSDEDFYIYFVSHAYKHYISKGTGIRTLLDFYVLNKAKKAAFDDEYLARELEKLGLAEYEQASSALAQKVFSSPASFRPEELTQDEQTLLQEHLISTYGTVKKWITSKLDRISTDQECEARTVKRKFVLLRLFPKRSEMIKWTRHSAPFIYAHPRLLPLAYIYRIVAAGLFRFRAHIDELRIVSKWRGRDDRGE